MNIKRGVLGGVICGIIGAVIWMVVAYKTGYEIGYVAWGIGLLVGYGVLKGGKGKGKMQGTIAVFITVLAIMVGKYGTCELLIRLALNERDSISNEALKTHAEIDSLLESFSVDEDSSETEILTQNEIDELLASVLTEDDSADSEILSQAEIDSLLEAVSFEYDSTALCISFIADEIIEERISNGEKINVSSDVKEGLGTKEDDYPPDIWKEAKAKWDRMSDDEKQKIYNKLNFDISTFDIFLESFGMLDILFFGLAIFTAYKIAAANKKENSNSDDESENKEQLTYMT